MNNSVFMNLTRGATLKTYMGLTVGEKGTDYTYAKDYSYVECKRANYKQLGENENFLLIKPTVEVSPKRSKILVVPNVQLAAAGSLSYQSIIEPDEKAVLGFSLKVENPIDFEKLDWVCRLYGIYG